MVGAPSAPVRTGEVLSESAWRTSIGARGRSYPHTAAAVNGDALPAERSRERLVLQCGAHRQAAAALGGGGGQGERRTGEVRVLDGGRACGLLDSVGEPLGGALFAHGDGVGVERLAFC